MNTQYFDNLDLNLSLDIEARLLYIILNFPEKQTFIFENSEKDFFKEYLNRLIYEEAKKLYLNGEIIDIGVIADNLNNHKINIQISYIMEDCFANSCLSAKYCKILFERYKKELIQAANTSEDFNTIKELEKHYLFEEKQNTHISSNAEDIIKEQQNRMASRIFTFWSAFDEVIGAFCGGDYITLGAGTGVGKTAIALNIARQVCLQEKHVLLFSLEMPKAQIQNRFVCMNEGLKLNKCRTFDFNLEEASRYEQGLKNLKEWNLNVIDDFNLTIEKMHHYMEAQKKKGLDFVILDYLGLMGGLAEKNQYERTTIISRKLKLLAGEFNVPILVLVQLNRDLKNRQNKRPLLSDIRESGAIEQDSDFVIFAHREGLYDANVPPYVLELRIAKNRHGASNRTIKLCFDLETQNIREFDY